MLRPPHLAQFCRRHGITKAGLARRSGVSRKHVIAVMQGRATPGWDVVARITAACSELSREAVTAEQLFGASRRRAS